jgi:hypothetical protein
MSCGTELVAGQVYPQVGSEILLNAVGRVGLGTSNVIVNIFQEMSLT